MYKRQTLKSLVSFGSVVRALATSTSTFLSLSLSLLLPSYILTELLLLSTKYVGAYVRMYVGSRRRHHEAVSLLKKKINSNYT